MFSTRPAAPDKTLEDNLTKLNPLTSWTPQLQTSCLDLSRRDNFRRRYLSPNELLQREAAPTPKMFALAAV